MILKSLAADCRIQISTCRVGAVLINYLGRMGASLWSGWIGLAGLALFFAAWQAGAEAYGDFILPTPKATLTILGAILQDAQNWAMIANTLLTALLGFVLAMVLGVVGGLIAGYSLTFMRMTRPILTLALGTPPVAWIVLAIIWFGATGGTVTMSVVAALTPVFFVNAAEGAATRDLKLDDMAKAFGVSAFRRIMTLGVRHVSQFLLPTMRVCLGSAVKVAVMAELLANVGGVGQALARARERLDMGSALAWVLVAVFGVIVIERLLIRPLSAGLNRWRRSSFER